MGWIIWGVVLPACLVAAWLIVRKPLRQVVEELHVDQARLLFRQQREWLEARFLNGPGQGRPDRAAPLGGRPLARRGPLGPRPPDPPPARPGRGPLRPRPVRRLARADRPATPPPSSNIARAAGSPTASGSTPPARTRPSSATADSSPSPRPNDGPETLRLPHKARLAPIPWNSPESWPRSHSRTRPVVGALADRGPGLQPRFLTALSRPARRGPESPRHIQLNGIAKRSPGQAPVDCSDQEPRRGKPCPTTIDGSPPE